MGNKFCTCHDSEKHGQTSVMCCNKCGLPDEEFWHNPSSPIPILTPCGWTRVEDGLPESEKDEIVLVIIYDTMYGVVDSVDYYKGRFQKSSGYDSIARMGTYMDFTDRTTHWMYKQLLPTKPNL